MIIPCKNKSVVIFDFDMTLVDTSRGSSLAYKTAFSVAGGYIDDSDIYTFMSEFLDRTYERIPNPAISFDDFCNVFYDVSHRYMAEMSQFSPRIKSLLDYLLSSNKKLAIVTNKDAFAVSSIMKLHGIDRSMFDIIITCDDVSSFKPNPEGLLMCIKQLGVNKSDCLYVGDNDNDLLFAQNAGVEGFLLTGIYPIK